MKIVVAAFILTLSVPALYSQTAVNPDFVKPEINELVTTYDSQLYKADLVQVYQFRHKQGNGIPIIDGKWLTYSNINSYRDLWPNDNIDDSPVYMGKILRGDMIRVDLDDFAPGGFNYGQVIKTTLDLDRLKKDGMSTFILYPINYKERELVGFILLAYKDKVKVTNELYESLEEFAHTLVPILSDKEI